MKHITSIIISLSLVLFASIAGADERKIDALISQMTIEEKVGQMTQINVDVLLKVKDKKRSIYSFNQDALHKAFTVYKVGSILNTPGEGATSQEKWVELIVDLQNLAMKTRLQIPILYGVDSIHGTNYAEEGTIFPHNIGIAASRNTALAAVSARITALETRALGVRWNFDPVFDLGRNPLWSRFPETFGEDPYLTTEMGMANLEAYQGDDMSRPDRVAATAKHFYGYGDPRSGKDRTASYIPESELQNLHLPPFEAAIRHGGIASIMINSGSLNRIPVHADKALLTGLIRDEWGYDGVIVSDWEDIIRLHTRHFIAENEREATRLGVEAGIDLSMVPHGFSFAEHLTSLVKDGEVSEARLDESVRRLLRMKFKLGLFDNPYPEKEAMNKMGLPQYKQVALQAAEESMTLLENKRNILPLSKNRKILLAGPAGDSRAALNGSWSFTWQGKDETRYPKSYLSFAEALEEKIGKNNVIRATYRGFDDARNYDTEQLIRKARGADIIVLALGEDAYAESPGGIDNLDLPDEQIALAKAAASTGKPVVLVLLEGRPRIVREIVEDMDAILLAYQPGSQGGQAIANVLFGDSNPSGRLPFSYPKHSGHIIAYDRLPLTEVYNNKAFGGYRPQWAFGHGLSYSTIRYSHLKLSSKTLRRNGKLTISVDVKNHDRKRAAAHSVELYVRDVYASLSPPFKQLKGFKKIALTPGQSMKVSFEIDPEALSFVNAEGERVTEAGAFTIMVGELKGEFEYRP